MAQLFNRNPSMVFDYQVGRFLRLVIALLTLVLVVVAVWKFCSGQSLSGLCAVIGVWISFRLATR
jgi:hypothetical protein